MPQVPVNRIKEVFTEESMRRALKAAKPGQLEEFASALHCTVPAADSPPTQAAVELELYSMCIRQAQLMSLDAWQTAYLLNIVKSVNDQSMAQYQLVETAFDLFRGHLIAHTVERPPFSKAVFTRQQSEQLLQWMLEAYFDYYKMYLYVFRSVITKVRLSKEAGA